MINMEKLYKKAESKYCNICNRFIDIKEVKENKIIMSITKGKHTAMVHKTCLVRR